MKKGLIIILIGVILIIIGAVLSLQKMGQPLAIEDILPEGPLGYVRIADLENNIDKFAATRFWKGIAGIDYEEILKQTKAREETLALYDAVKKNFPSPETQGLIKKFLGQEFAAAVYPVQLDDFSPENLIKVTSGIFFVTRLKPETQFAEFFATLFSQIHKDISTETITYKKHTIHVLSTNDARINIGYVRIKDLFVFGVGDKPARACVDVFSKESGALSGDSRYLEVSPGFLEGAHFTGYADITLFISNMKKQILAWATQNQENPELIAEQVEENLKQTKGFKAFGYSGIFDEVSQFKMDVHFDKSALNPDVKSLYDCLPKENRTFPFVPADVLGYQWSACYDFSYYWQQAKKEMQKAASASQKPIPLDEMIAGMEEKINLSIEGDILPALGDEAGGFLADIDTAGIFPAPKLVFFIKVAAKEKAEKIIKTLIDQQSFVRPEEETYGGVLIKYITLPLAPNLKPAYAFLDDYLLITTERQLLKDSIDILKDPGLKSLTANQGFQKVNFGLTDKNNSVFFLQSGELMGKVQIVIDWANNWSAIQLSRQEAFKRGSEKRLTDVKADAGKKKAELAELKTELSGIKESLQQKESGADVSALGDLVRQIKEKEGDIQAAQEMEKELDEMIKGYDAQAGEAKSRQVLINKLVKPLLEAFAFVKVFALKGVFGEGILETFMYWKVE